MPAAAGDWTARSRPRAACSMRRGRAVPIIYTTSPWRPDGGTSPSSRRPTRRRGSGRGTSACRIDERVAPQPGDLVLEKENASAFFGTHLAPYLIGHGVDTLFITGCSTSACIHATATDAKSYRFRPIVVRDCVGDRSAVAHEWTLFDIQARFADVVPLDEVLTYLSAFDERISTNTPS